MGKIPLRLERPPLVEAVVEVRFAGTGKAVGDLLPGLVYEAMGGGISDIRELPLGNVPRDVRSAKPATEYQPHWELDTDDGLLLRIGDRVAAVSNSNYLGWIDFRKRAKRLLDAVGKTKLVTHTERLSMKYVNLIEQESDDPLQALKVQVSMGNLRPSNRGFFLRTQFDTGDGGTTIVEVASPVNVRHGQDIRAGVLLSIDAIQPVDSENFFPVKLRTLNALHSRVEEMFFALLQGDVLEEFDPIWEAPE